MTSTTKNVGGAPEWATTVRDEDNGEWVSYERDLEPSATFHEHGDPTEYPATFKLIGSDRDTEDALMLSGEALGFRSPGRALAFAKALRDAAEEWQGLRDQTIANKMTANLRECMESAGIDLVGLADRAEMEVERLDAIVAGEMYLSLTELAFVSKALGVEPSRLIRGV